VEPNMGIDILLIGVVVFLNCLFCIVIAFVFPAYIHPNIELELFDIVIRGGIACLFIFSLCVVNVRQT